MSVYIDNPEKLLKVNYPAKKLPAPKRGYIHAINSKALYQGIRILGMNKNGSFDAGVGATEIQKIGNHVKQGEPLMMVHYNDESNLKKSLDYLNNTYRLAPKRPTPVNLIADRLA